MKAMQLTIITTLFLILICAAPVLAQQEDIGEYGDAPEGALAYPAAGVIGAFPTCINVGPAAWVYHGPAPYQFFGPLKDFEPDGNAGSCPIYGPYDLDECFQDGDAGLLNPGAYTIVGATVVPCAGQAGPLGIVCTMAMWGPSVDIWVANQFNGPAFVNVLMDWNRDGRWAPSAQSLCAAPEHVLIDFPIPGGYVGPLSALAPPPFLIGGDAGHVWSRFTISETPVGTPDWDGSGFFEDGESEDYLLLVDASVANQGTSWGGLKSIYR